MKSIFGNNKLLNRSNCLELELTHPCSVCKCRKGSEEGWYDTACCWINQHYYELEHNKAMGRSLKETKERFEFLLIGEGINATIPERLLYLQIVVSECFPEFLVLVNELADKHHIECLNP